MTATAGVAVTATPAVNAANPFDVDGVRADRAVVSWRESPDAPPPAATPMAWTAAGILADLDTRTMSRLRRCAARGDIVTTDAIAAASFDVECYVHLTAGDTRRVLEVLRSETRLVVRPRGSDAAASPVDSDRFAELLERAPRYRGSLDPLDIDVPVGRSFELEQPYVASHVELTRRTMKTRLYRDLNVVNPGTDRRLADERMHARLPRGYDPRRPAGLLVWVSPTPRGRIPVGVIGASLDEHDLVCISVDEAGNDRDHEDRLQLVLDAVATATRRFHVDERRILIAGLSGGGKVGSLLTLTFPEIFAGAVPIVGIATHGTLDDPRDRHRLPYFSRPRGALLRLARQRRMAVVTGPLDENYEEMKIRSEMLNDDGFDLVTFVDVPGMAHTLPPHDVWEEALAYVDEPSRAMRAAEVAEAQTLLDALAEDADDAALVEIMETAPFSEPAWRAYERLASRSSSTK